MDRWTDGQRQTDRQTDKQKEKNEASVSVAAFNVINVVVLNQLTKKLKPGPSM
jgi:hypothetical protein